LAGTLHFGTWLASAAIGLGLALALLDSRFSAPKLAILRDMRIATIGIALLILLPVVRVVVMLIVYLRHRDYRFSAIALLVLTIICWDSRWVWQEAGTAIHPHLRRRLAGLCRRQTISSESAHKAYI